MGFEVNDLKDVLQPWVHVDEYRSKLGRDDKNCVVSFAIDDPVARQMVNFAYVIGDRATGECVLIDPAYNAGELLEIVGADGLEPTVAVFEGGSGGNGGNGGSGDGNGTISDATQNVSLGNLIRSEQTSGTYDSYNAYRDSMLATSTISVSPALVRSGTVTHVYWNADHVVSCNVSAPNGDHWSAQTPDGAGGTLTSPVGGNESSPITGQTIYTITCPPAIGRTLTDQATVNIIPKYREN